MGSTITKASSIPIRLAYQAPTISLRVDIGILWCVLMPLRTAHLPCVLCREALTPEYIYLSCHGLKVIGIDAGSVPAEVVDMRSVFWDWSPVRNLPGSAMCHDICTVEPEPTIPMSNNTQPFRAGRVIPEPGGSQANPGSKAFDVLISNLHAQKITRVKAFGAWVVREGCPYPPVLLSSAFGYAADSLLITPGNAFCSSGCACG
jgi:hypothetical protein